MTSLRTGPDAKGLFGSFGGLLLIVGLIGIVAGGRGRDDH